MKNLFVAFTFFFATASAFNQSNISFEDRSIFAGLSGSELNKGLALADYDLDGDEDLYVSSVGDGYDRLYRNMGNLIFEDATVQAGLPNRNSRASAWGDLDNDGDPDLYCVDALFINNGDATFTEKAVESGVFNTNIVSSIAIADVNLDGWLDMYLSCINSPNTLYLNEGSGHFTDNTNDSGAWDLAVGMGAVFFDYDNDGDQDLYQAHDAGVQNLLFQNDGQGRFVDVAHDAYVNYGGFGMGAEVGDINNDGFMDIYVTNLFSNKLFLYNDHSSYIDVTDGYKVGDTGMGWGSVIADFDNDRLPDIYVCNDSYFPNGHDNILYHNMINSFEELEEDDPCLNSFASYATVASDFNDDGKLDLLIANAGAPGVQLLENTSVNDHHYIAFYLEGVESNRDAIGSRLKLESGSGTQYDQVIGNSGYNSGNGRWIHFGLGDETQIVKLTINWPSGFEEEVTGFEADSKYRIREGEGIVSSTDHPKTLAQHCVVFGNSDKLIIEESSIYGNSKLIIFDMTGRMVYSHPGDLAPLSTIHLPPLVPGIYQLLISSNQQTCITTQLLGYR